MPRVAAKTVVSTPPEPVKVPRKRVSSPLAPPPDAPCRFPADAGTWGLENAEGEQLSWSDSRGVEVYDWPMADFSVNEIRKRWGPGPSLVRFSSIHGEPRGRKRFTLAGRAVEGDEDEVPAPDGALVATDPTERAIRLLTVLDTIATNKADRQVTLQSNFLLETQRNAERMFGAAMGRDERRERREISAMPDRLEAALTRISERLDALESDDGYEDDEEDDRRGGDRRPTGPEYPDEWTSIGDMLYRVIARNAPNLEAALPELVKGLVEKLKADAAAKAAA